MATGAHYHFLGVNFIASSLAIFCDSYSMASPPYSSQGQEGKQQQQQQLLLEMAERVITACDIDKLHVDRSECQSLCHDTMCCFDETSEDGYGCQDDVSKDCAVYAMLDVRLWSNFGDGDGYSFRWNGGG